jgi:plastocyanin
VNRRTAITIGAVVIVAIVAIAAISLSVVRTKSIPSVTGQKSSSKVLVTIPKNSSTVNFGQTEFKRDPTQIRIGDIVKWKNSDTVNHTVTYGTGPKDSQSGKLFDSGALKPGKTFEFKFTKAGIYDYYCTLHPAMAGQVNVRHE